MAFWIFKVGSFSTRRQEIHDPEMRQWIIGKNHHEYCEKRRLPKSLADHRQKQIDKCIAEKKLVTFEEPIMDKSGHLKVYLRMFCPVLNEQGKVTHVIGHGQEITKLKKTEEKLKKALAEVEELKNRLQAENDYLQEEIKVVHNFEEIITGSKVFKKVLGKVEQVAATNATVIILGETGTGKELLVRAVHNLSERRDRPLVKINCAGLTSSPR